MSIPKVKWLNVDLWFDQLHYGTLENIKGVGYNDIHNPPLTSINNSEQGKLIALM